MRSKIPYILLIILLSLVYWQWFLPGPKVANDFPLVSADSLKSLMDFPMTWTERGGDGLGIYSIFSLWSYPASLIMGALANLGLSFSLLERLFFIFPFLILGSLGIWKFLGFYKFSVKAKFISSVFYLANTYIILLIDGGQLLIVLAYAFFPLSFLAIEKAIGQTWHKKILASLGVVLLGFLDIRFVFVLLLLSLLRFLYGFFLPNGKERKFWIKQWGSLGVISITIFIGFNAFWLISYSSFPLNQDTFSKLTQITSSAEANIGHSMLVISPHWYKNIFGQISKLRPEFIFIPILAFLAPLIKKRKFTVGFWLMVAVVAIFLSKGLAQPFPDVYSFLYSKVPGFSLFRDSTKFFFLLALSFTFLIAVSIDWLLNKYKSLKFKFVISFLLVFYLLFLIRPLFLNQMTGMLSSPANTGEFNEIAKTFQNDFSFSRIFWIPSTQPLTYSDSAHPVVEALRMTEKRPFASAIKGTYELFNYLREAPYMGQLFDVSAIGYIAYPSLDKTKENVSSDDISYYQTFFNQLANLPWVTGDLSTSAPVFKVNTHQDKFFPVSNIWWVIGSDKIYNEATKSAKLALSNNALIFAEENAGLGKQISEFPEAKVVLYDKNTTDLAASFIDSEDLVFPSKLLGREPDVSGWWKREGKDLIGWRYFLKTKYGIDNQDFDLGGGWAVGEGKLNLELKSENGKLRKDMVLLARVLESSQSGNLSFYTGQDLVGKVNTKTENTNVRWFEVGTLGKDGAELTIKSEGQINVVNALASLPKEVWQSYLSKVDLLKNSGRIKDYIPENADVNNVSVSYKEHSPTKYEVSIKGLKKETMIIFSSNYDNLWKLGNQSSVPIYSLLNGFKVDKNGSFEVTFEPQNKILPGLVVSILVFAATLSFLIISKKKND